MDEAMVSIVSSMSNSMQSSSLGYCERRPGLAFGRLFHYTVFRDCVLCGTDVVEEIGCEIFCIPSTPCNSSVSLTVRACYSTCNYAIFLVFTNRRNVINLS